MTLPGSWSVTERRRAASSAAEATSILASTSTGACVGTLVVSGGLRLEEEADGRAVGEPEAGRRTGPARRWAGPAGRSSAALSVSATVLPAKRLLDFPPGRLGDDVDAPGAVGGGEEGDADEQGGLRGRGGGRGGEAGEEQEGGGEDAGEGGVGTHGWGTLLLITRSGRRGSGRDSPPVWVIAAW